MSVYPPSRSQAFARPKNVLDAILLQAVNIRKLLLREKSFGRRAWREFDDAVRLAESIEALASKAVNFSAADAIDSVELLELMLDELDKKLTCILAS
jgi:hypothetical protein